MAASLQCCVMLETHTNSNLQLTVNTLKCDTFHLLTEYILSESIQEHVVLFVWPHSCTISALVGYRCVETINHHASIQNGNINFQWTLI